MPARKIDIKKPDVLEYHEHIGFLRDWIEYLKATQTGFSMRQLAKASELAIGYLPMCLAGKRVLSSKALFKLMPHLRLSEKESKALELLHMVGTSEDPASRIAAINELSRHSGFRKKNSQEVDLYRYMTRWYYVAIRELVMLDDFKPDPKWIQARLGKKVSLAEVDEALTFLLEKGLLKKDPNGNLRMTEQVLTCKEGIYKASLGEFHRQMLTLAAQSIEATERSRRYLMGHTMAVSSADFEKAKEIIDRAVAELEKLGQAAKKTEDIYHFELTAFPLTKPSNDEGEKS